jgi:glutathione S-transferase
MLKLHGVPMSNYYNMVKIALLEKRLPFEEVVQPPTQDEPYLVKSPMGKIPTLETDRGVLTETHAILDYLEDAHPTPAFRPADAFARAKARELTQSIELYIELVARRGLGVVFGRPVADDVKAGIKADLGKGIKAVNRLTKFGPWVAGQDLSYADFVLYYTLALGAISAKANADIDLVGELGAGAWLTRMAARDSVKKADADAAAFRKRMAANR